MKRPVVYIAGPLTHGNQLDNVANALVVYNHLIVSGYAPICPHLAAFAHVHVSHEYETYMDIFFAIIPKCDAVLRMDGHSPGADREVAWANQHGIPVVICDGDLDMQAMDALYRATVKC